MNVRYKKEANAAYMILEGSVECEEYAARMLQENRIRGLMPLTIHQLNGVKEYYFDISCGRSMSGVLEKRPVTLSEVRSFLHALADIADQMEEYLMNIGHLILEPGMICLPVENRRGTLGYDHLEADFSRAVFCCHPAVEKDFLAQVRELIQYFLNKMDHMEEQSIEKAYELFRISQKEYFRMDELLEVCDAMETEKSSPEVSTIPLGNESPEPQVEPEHSRRVLRGRKAGGNRGTALLGVVMMCAGAGLCFWNLWMGILLLAAGGGLVVLSTPAKCTLEAT